MGGIVKKIERGGGKRSMASKMLIELEFDCPYQWTCQTQKIKDLCLKKMKVVIFKLEESDLLHSWLPLINFCDRQPELHHVMNALRAQFGPDLSFDLRKRSLLDY